MAENTMQKNRAGYGYKYTDLAETNKFLAEQGINYYQYVETLNGEDYIYTVPIVDGKELPARRGCRIVNAELSGKSNPAQEHGSAITYARRYSLWMAFGLATEDDDAASLTVQKTETRRSTTRPAKATGGGDLAELRKMCLESGVHEEFVAGLYQKATLDELPASAVKYLVGSEGWEKVLRRFLNA